MIEESPVIAEDLWNQSVSEQTYPSAQQYYAHIWNQYEICVEMADRISARRSRANGFFLSLHTFILGFLGVSYDEGRGFFSGWALGLLLVTVLVLCYLWWRLVKSYRQLNTAKYKVIGEFEKRMPASPYWSAEWKALGEGRDRKLYVPLTEVEEKVPIIFAVLYVMAALLLLIGGTA